MEKLSLRKFDAFQINERGLKTVRGGVRECTGGGFRNVYHRDGDSYILFSSFTWDSDVKDESGNIMHFGQDTKFYN